jgi:hypothetical protein
MNSRSHFDFRPLAVPIAVSSRELQVKPSQLSEDLDACVSKIWAVSLDFGQWCLALKARFLPADENKITAQAMSRS